MKRSLIPSAVVAASALLVSAAAPAAATSPNETTAVATATTTPGSTDTTDPGASAHSASWTVTVNGAVDAAATLAVSDLEALPQHEQEATYQSGDSTETHTFEGPLLLDVLDLAGPAFDEGAKNDKLNHAVVVTASDGYVAAVAWGEIDPEFENKEVLLALREDGAPLVDGPRLTVPGDGRGGRYVSAVVDVTIVSTADGAPAGASASPTHGSAPAGTAATTTDTASTATLSGELTVFAAASLTDAYTEIGDAFTAEHPDVDVTFNFAASSELVGQINEGAPADVFASADQANMDKLVAADGAAGEPVTFATNSLEIIVEPGNPLGIEGLDDLTDPELIVVSCDPAVPIGAYTEEVLANAGVDVEFDSLEENVRAVSEKVQSGEADAGIVYATDVNAAGDRGEGVEIPADVNIEAEYPIAVTAEAGNPDAAAAFEQFVLGPEGQDILESYGFAPA